MFSYRYLIFVKSLMFLVIQNKPDAEIANVGFFPLGGVVGLTIKEASVRSFDKALCSYYL